MNSGSILGHPGSNFINFGNCFVVSVCVWLHFGSPWLRFGAILVVFLFFLGGESVFWVVGLLGCCVVGFLGSWILELLGCFVSGLLGCWVVWLSVGCWVVGLLGCWVVGLVGWWVVELDCWIVGLLVCCSVGLLVCCSILGHPVEKNMKINKLVAKKSFDA